MNKKVALCILLNNSISLQKVCGDHLINYLIRELNDLPIEKIIITNINLPTDYQPTVKIVKIDSSFHEVSLLKQIKQILDAEIIILLPSNIFFLKEDTIQQILKMMENNNAVIGALNSSDNQYPEIITNNNHVISIDDSKSNPHSQFPYLRSSGIIAINTAILNNNDTTPITEFVIKTVSANHLVIDGLIIINNTRDLVNAERITQNILREKAINNGVFLLDPQTTYLSYDSKISPEVIIHPNVFIGAQVIIEPKVSILSFSHIEGVHIKQNCTIGPFARIRSKTTIDSNSHVGNFVEIKNSAISQQVKVKHLSYIGDTSIGQNTNIGAGVITCNYDGHKKHHTTIEKDCFIGANSSLIAPLYIAENATVGAGSTITHNITKDNLVVARAQQINRKKRNN